MHKNTTAEAANRAPIVLASHVNHANLVDCVQLVNAMCAQGLESAFPEDLPLDAVRSHLIQHGDASAAVGTARANVRQTVADRNKVHKNGKAVYARLLRIVNGSYPPGSAGRVDYFPVDNTDPSLGDLLLAVASGVEKRSRPPLPAGVTVAQVREIGNACNATLQARKKSGKAHGGAIPAADANDKRTAEIRRRLREVLSGLFGPSDGRLVEFGIKPRVFAGGRRRKSGEGGDEGVAGGGEGSEG